MLDDFDPEELGKIDPEIWAQLEHPPTTEQRPDGTWIARMNNHVGMGKTEQEALYEMAEKVVEALTGPKL